MSDVKWPEARAGVVTIAACPSCGGNDILASCDGRELSKKGKRLSAPAPVFVEGRDYLHFYCTRCAYTWAQQRRGEKTGGENDRFDANQDGTVGP